MSGLAFEDAFWYTIYIVGSLEALNGDWAVDKCAARYCLRHVFEGWICENSI